MLDIVSHKMGDLRLARLATLRQKLADLAIQTILVGFGGWILGDDAISLDIVGAIGRGLGTPERSERCRSPLPWRFVFLVDCLFDGIILDVAFDDGVFIVIANDSVMEIALP